MYRRQIFYAITLILLAIIIFLLLRGRSAEKERAAQNTRLEQIASIPPSPVRAILPRDLEIVSAEVSWSRNPDEKNAVAAHHDITIRNNGGGSYDKVWLRLEYVDGEGKSVDIRTHEVNGSLLPGRTTRVPEIMLDGLPDGAADFRVSILSADLEDSND